MSEWYFWKRIKKLKRKIRSLRVENLRLAVDLENWTMQRLHEENRDLKQMHFNLVGQIRELNKQSVLLPPEKITLYDARPESLMMERPSPPMESMIAFEPGTTMPECEVAYFEAMTTLQVMAEDPESSFYKAFHFEARFVGRKLNKEYHYCLSPEAIKLARYPLLIKMKDEMNMEFERMILKDFREWEKGAVS